MFDKIFISLDKENYSKYNELNYSNYFYKNITNYKILKISNGKSIYYSKYTINFIDMCTNGVCHEPSKQFASFEIKREKLAPSGLSYSGSEVYLGECIISTINTSLQQLFFDIIINIDIDAKNNYDLFKSNKDRDSLCSLSLY